MADVNFPSFPIVGQTFEDANGTLWEYNGQIWTDKTYEDITSLNDLIDYKDVSPVTNDWVGYNENTGYWEALPYQEADYYSVFTFASAGTDYFDVTHPSYPTIPFDSVAIDQGPVTGKFDTTAHTFTIPATGFWEVDVRLSSTNTTSAGSGQNVFLDLWRNNAFQIRLHAFVAQDGGFSYNNDTYTFSGEPIYYYFAINDVIHINQSGFQSFDSAAGMSGCYWSMRYVG